MKEFENLKVGDEMMCAGTYSMEFAKVTRITSTMAGLDNGQRFMLNSGRQVGSAGSYRTKYWHFATAEAHAKHDVRIKMAAARNGLEQIKVTPQNVDVILGFLKHFSQELAGEVKEPS